MSKRRRAIVTLEWNAGDYDDWEEIILGSTNKELSEEEINKEVRDYIADSFHEDMLWVRGSDLTLKVEEYDV